MLIDADQILGIEQGKLLSLPCLGHGIIVK